MEGQQNLQPPTSKKSKPIVSPLSPLVSHKSMIITLCVAILLWMLLQGQIIKDIKGLFGGHHKHDKMQSTFDKTKDTVEKAYDQTADSAKNTLQDVIDKVKDSSSNMKTVYDEKLNAMQDSVQQNKDYLKDKLNEVKDNVVQTVRETVDTIKEKSQDTFDALKEKSQETIDMFKDKSQETVGTFKDNSQETMNSIKDKSQETINSLKDKSQETMNSFKDKSQETMNSLKDKSQETMNSLKDKSQETVNLLKDKSQETVNSLKDKSQETIDLLKEKSQETVESAKSTSQETMDKAKETFAETKANFQHMLDMIGLIEQAELNLQEFLAPHLKIEQQLPTKVLSDAKAFVFLTIVKGGIGLTGVFGTGIVIARNEIGRWSGPCAIALVGVDIGLNIGVEKSSHLIVLRDDTAVRAFASKGQLKMGMDASIAVGPIGRDASFGLSVGDKGYATMVSYSMAKGAYAGLSFEGQIIMVRNDCNEKYYGKKVEANKILEGAIKSPKNKHLVQIYRNIDEYTARNLVYPEHGSEL